MHRKHVEMQSLKSLISQNSEARLLVVEDRLTRKRHYIYIDRNNKLYNLDKYDINIDRYWLMATIP